MRVEGYTLTFECKVDTALSGNPLVVWNVTGRWFSGRITASKSGVLVEGRFPTMTTEECVLFEETLAEARMQAFSI